MKRDISVLRIFRLGQFEDIRIGDDIKDIPEEVAANEALMATLYELMLLSVEIKINKYYVMREATKAMTPQESIAYLEDQRDILIKDFISKVDERNAVQTAKVDKGVS
jgi:hypothetical protein